MGQGEDGSTAAFLLVLSDIEVIRTLIYLMDNDPKYEFVHLLLVSPNLSYIATCESVSGRARQSQNEGCLDFSTQGLR